MQRSARPREQQREIIYINPEIRLAFKGDSAENKAVTVDGYVLTDIPIGIIMIK